MDTVIVAIKHYFHNTKKTQQKVQVRSAQGKAKKFQVSKSSCVNLKVDGLPPQTLQLSVLMLPFAGEQGTDERTGMENMGCL